MTIVNLPVCVNGFDTSGPTRARPKNADVGTPFFDTDLLLWLVWSGSDWEVVNAKALSADSSPPPETAQASAPPAESPPAENVLEPSVDPAAEHAAVPDEAAQ